MSAAVGRRSWRVPVGPVAAFLVGAAFLAGAVHICTILLIPAVARADGWSQLATVAGEDRFAEIPAAGPNPADVAGLDPLFLNSACRIRLGDAPAAITLEARDRFWSLALYDRQGTIIFSLNDRTAAEGRLDMLVVNRAQNARLEQTPPPGIDQTIIVESQSNELIALLRLFAPSAAAQQQARVVVAAAECVPDALPDPAQISSR